MKITKNVGNLDRIIRLVVAELLFLTGFFWAYGVVQIVLFFVALALLLTAFFSFCGLYTLLKVNTCPISETVFSTKMKVVTLLILILIAAVVSYASMFFSQKIFLEDYNKMNQYYKQTLFFTGQNNREESVKNYANLVEEFGVFYKKYSAYHPYVIKNDKSFNSDLQSVNDLILSLGDAVNSGDLPNTHKEFEKVRPIFQDILKRNGFSMLAVYLVDFHDAMEKIITVADAKDSNALIAVYGEVSEKLKAVEEVANDDEIKNIRQKLEQVYESAKSGNVKVLPNQAAELKSSFVKVYLKRG